MKSSKDLKLDNVVTFKKPHPCGSNQWLIINVGSQLEIQCMKCNRKIILSRKEFERRYKSKSNRL
ncbi:MAG TPA: DUF951 domain-containing protein [Candidatus Hydromicrobium sp.]